MASMKVADVLVACDTVECGYRIVELEDGRCAFVWGNIRAHDGDVLPADLVADATAEKGIQIFDGEDADEDAIAAYRDCAEALSQCSASAGDEMLSRLADFRADPLAL